jgi:hypothetical protein
MGCGWWASKRCRVRRMRALLPALLWLMLPVARAEDPLLRLELIGVESTDYTMDCLQPGAIEQGCLVWNLWHVYDVRVKQVLKGEFPGDRLRVAMYAHWALNIEAVDDVFGVVSRFENLDTAGKLGTPYFIRDYDLSQRYVCIPETVARDLDPDAMPENPAIDVPERTCYDVERIGSDASAPDCGDLGEREDELACRERRLHADETALKEIEQRLRVRHEAQARESETGARQGRLRAYDRSVADFRRYLGSTCAFEATQSGVIDADEEDRRSLELACRSRMIQQRIRLLHRQRQPY